MKQVLEDFYERELANFVDVARDFARRYPAEAGRLVADPGRVVDPHLDRFIEGFALLSGRIHHKLDSDFPELTEALLQVLYPHLLNPIPSMSVAQFSLNAQTLGQHRGLVIPKHTQLRTRPIGNPPIPCRWRTGYLVHLWPIRLTQAQILRSYFPTGYPIPPRTQAVLVLQFECLGPWRFSDLAVDRMRFGLSGVRQVIANLYETLFNHTLQVGFRSLDAEGSREVLLLPPTECLFQVGFEREEGLVPLPAESFLGQRLLLEFMSCREKFWFVDLGGWPQMAQAGFGKKVEVVCFLNRLENNLEQGVSAQTFLAGCTPVINLFDKSAEPLALTQRTFEYRVVPSRTQPMGMEVMSVDSVTALDPGRGHIDMEPFYARDFNATLAHNETLARRASEGTSTRRASEGSSTQRANEGEEAVLEDYAFWFAHRRASYVEDDRGTEVYLSLVDSGFEPRRPADAVLHIKTTCSNRDWPARFQRGGEALYLEQDASPLALDSQHQTSKAEGSLGPIVCLFQPTVPLRPPLRRSTYWRLLAQNNLNHSSLCDSLDGRAALQEMLRLCNFAEPEVVPQLAAVNHEIIEGISAIQCRPILGRVSQGAQIGTCRGLEVTLEFDERRYVGVGAFLFACVLERYLAYHAGLNSFSQLIAKTKQAQGYFKKWPPRAADRPLR